ncbi:hypothetical protein FraEuI1c_2740 [Pseudofrankia inefficax]|uniref:Uncharacterized protein n=1 Tax=Pseudofrankia inefficax (strain DSM 45817 / CECT 9037 / DDB 130130 / EuI1c) TaxID=298654 RepID=E3J6J5_PSEI1|nr:hypothetical protein FraEuI1c_2740 [Pseudofrankia inefficax]
MEMRSSVAAEETASVSDRAAVDATATVGSLVTSVEILGFEPFVEISPLVRRMSNTASSTG